MRAQQPQRFAKSATTGNNQHTHYSLTDDLSQISANDYNQIKIELQVLRSDFDRIFNGYRQLGIAHAELLLEQPQAWREYIINVVYVSTLHPDVRDDIAIFLEAVELHGRLKGVVR